MIKITVCGEPNLDKKAQVITGYAKRGGSVRQTIGSPLDGDMEEFRVICLYFQLKRLSNQRRTRYSYQPIIDQIRENDDSYNRASNYARPWFDNFQRKILLSLSFSYLSVDPEFPRLAQTFRFKKPGLSATCQKKNRLKDISSIVVTAAFRRRPPLKEYLLSLLLARKGTFFGRRKGWGGVALAAWRNLAGPTTAPYCPRTSEPPNAVRRLQRANMRR